MPSLSSQRKKKSRFLLEALAKCGVAERAEVMTSQFAEVPLPEASFVTCRALDKFVQHLPKLIKWSAGNTRLFFGGPSLREGLNKERIKVLETICCRCPKEGSCL